MFKDLPFDLQEYIFKLCNLKCHTCKKNIMNISDITRRVYNNYFCSHECYNFI